MVVSEGAGPLAGVTAALAGDEPMMLARLLEGYRAFPVSVVTLRSGLRHEEAYLRSLH